MAGITTMFAGPLAVRAAASGGAAYLRRSSYAGLVGKSFQIDGGSFTLASVLDVAGARKESALVGSEDAFVLEFTGPPSALTSGVHNFSQSDLGDYVLFGGPVGEPKDGTQSYEVVIDRSVGKPADPPEAPEPAAPAMTPTEKDAAAEELRASTPIHEVPGAPAPAKVARKHRVKRKHRAKHVKAKHVKAKQAPAHRRRRTKRRK